MYPELHTKGISLNTSSYLDYGLGTGVMSRPHYYTFNELHSIICIKMGLVLMSTSIAPTHRALSNISQAPLGTVSASTELVLRKESIFNCIPFLTSFQLNPF